MFIPPARSIEPEVPRVFPVEGPGGTANARKARGAFDRLHPAKGAPGDRREFSTPAPEGGRYSLPVKGRLYYQPGAELRVPYYPPGEREGVGVLLTFREPREWECAEGCRGLEAIRGDGFRVIGPTHTWDCAYWYTPEGKDATPFD